jgi:hypothetical protein
MSTYQKMPANWVVPRRKNIGLYFVVFNWILLSYLSGFFIGVFNIVVIGDYFRSLSLLLISNSIKGSNDLLMFSFVCALLICLVWISSCVLSFFQCVLDCITNRAYRYIYWLIISVGELIGLYTLFAIQDSNQTRFNYLQDSSNGIIHITVGIIIQITSIFISEKAWKKNSRWGLLKDWAIYISAIGGTSFYGMNLTNAIFDGADLRNTDLRETILKNTSFVGAENLELARIKGTILEDKRVRDLLVDPKSGQGKNFNGADFTGAYLVEANLQGANLTGANLQNVNLTGANLAAANLRCVNAIDTDFTDATLHDICIQDWNISKNTMFTNVKCRGVYLKENQQEPKPDSYGSVNGKEFQAGEFEKWVKVLTNTIDLIFQNGLDLKSLAFAITQASIDYENTQFTAESIEHKGDGVVVVKVSSTGKASKSELHIALTNEYKYAQDAIASGHELVLRAKEEEIARLTYRMEAQDRQIHGLIACISQPKESSSVTIHKYYNSTHHSTQEGHIVEQQYQAGGNIDQSNRSINAGRDFNSTGSVINSDEMRGQITNTVNQNQDLAEIISSLQKLQTAIQDDPNLKEAAKARSLEEVKVLSEEAKKEPHERDKSILPKAISCLSYLGELVTDGSKLSQICQTYLPTISKFFGL